MGLFKTDTLIDKVVAVDEVPAVRNARESLLKAREWLAAAEAEARKFKPGTMTLRAVEAAQELESSHEAVSVAERNHREIREREREHIRVAGWAMARELRRSLLPGVEDLRDKFVMLCAQQAENDRLVGGRRSFEIDANGDEPLLRAVCTWIEANQRERLL